MASISSVSNPSDSNVPDETGGTTGGVCACKLTATLSVKTINNNEERFFITFLKFRAKIGLIKQSNGIRSKQFCVFAGMFCDGQPSLDEAKDKLVAYKKYLICLTDRHSRLSAVGGLNKM